MSGHFQLYVGAEPHQRGTSGALERVDVSIDDGSELGLDRIDELVFGQVAALELGPRVAVSC